MQNVIAVLSGKGGVGKSTVAVNLAVALAATGAKVALVDADFYGPSIPTMLGGGELSTDDQGRIIPPARHGVKYMSIGFFLPQADDAVIWRGPMLTKALRQLFEDVNWGMVDYCVVDLPPGTGDIPISLTQMLQLVGAVVVTTPQEVALADVRKAITMLSKVNVPLLGIVENMSGITTPNGEVIKIFGEGGGAALAERYGVPLLATIPLQIRIREGGDQGVPISTESKASESSYFHQIALQLTAIIANRSSSPKLKVVN